MAVSPKKTTKRRKRNRRSHHAISPIAYSKCVNCNAPVRSHNSCGECGHYGEKANRG
ncbi:MAG TPA: 50S ribosomal protein L32 [Fusobacteria bacterium]|nr:50S ribosomal protein L32 [Fusobacteriota bacterium]